MSEKWGRPVSKSTIWRNLGQEIKETQVPETHKRISNEQRMEVIKLKLERPELSLRKIAVIMALKFGQVVTKSVVERALKTSFENFNENSPFQISSEYSVPTIGEETINSPIKARDSQISDKKI